ncbi:cell division protein [Methanoregula sp.]|jgi:cell division GTPase FtsZ|uniref:tubulin/FtsZ family protein n=1 Tax=Methanoregula sp. TaxID=2052170 RepID=UPI003C757EE8
MRIVAIGLGGAGCRIVDSLYVTDRRSSRVACIEALAVDVDEPTLQNLTGIPHASRIFFPTFDPGNAAASVASDATATIDIGEIVSRVHNFESGETDAIIICCGLGGSMADIAPHVIAGLRASIVEPIFGLVTLPCLAEGEKKSGKAADDIDILSPLLDGLILFDNETWYKKIRAGHAKLVKKERGFAEMLGFGKKEPEISPELATYNLLNEAIVRRISLILKAGEFRADGGIDLAEVVLDSGEVLNTMKGMGFITIGYAVERLPSNPLAFLDQLKPAGVFNEEDKKRASRIVELAKQAIYHEISTPCDMTSAHKALVLVAGPSHELSMKGFMTVRKWIDRSIRGIETRSGDYPVMNTKNVAIIVMLSGLENIPRITELREIRSQAHLPPQRESLQQRVAGKLRDDMIVLPMKMEKEQDTARPKARDVVRSQEPLPPPEVHAPRAAPGDETPVAETLPRSAGRSHAQALTDQVPPVKPRAVGGAHTPAGGQTYHAGKEDIAREITPPQHRHVVTHTGEGPGQHRVTASPHVSREVHGQNNASPAKSPTDTQAQEAARRRIELELQRQRMMAFSGSRPKPGDDLSQPHQVHHQLVRQKQESIPDKASHQHPVVREPSQDIPLTPETRTIIVKKRSPAREVVLVQAHRLPDAQPDELPQENTPPSPEYPTTPVYSAGPEPEERPVTVKDPAFRAKDGIFSGKTVRGSPIPSSRDQSLIHTNLTKKSHVTPDPDDAPTDNATGTGSAEAVKQDKKTRKHDDISWI